MTNDWRTRIEWAVGQIRDHSSIISGCSEADLADFQRKRSLELPEAYRHFLGAAGANCGRFLQGSDLRFEDLDSLQSSAQSLLGDDGGPGLPENAFVFCSHQGYQFLFFQLGGGPDPEVRYYLEGEGEFKLVAPGFSDWLVRTVQDEFPDTSHGGAEV